MEIASQPSGLFISQTIEMWSRFHHITQFA